MRNSLATFFAVGRRKGGDAGHGPVVPAVFADLAATADADGGRQLLVRIVLSELRSLIVETK